MMTLTSVDLLALSPMLIVVIGALILLLLEFVPWTRGYATIVAVVTLSIALVATPFAPQSVNPLLTNWLRFDPLSTFFTLFFLLTALATTLLSITYFRPTNPSQIDYFFFLLSALLGLQLIGSSADFLTLFLGIETLSLSLYILCGFLKHDRFSGESALKYFFLGSLAAAFLLYGIALIYGATGTTNFQSLSQSFHGIPSGSPSLLFFSGIAFVTLALFFKGAIVPFHSWAPDIYSGSPTPVTTILAVGSKAGAFAALTILFLHFLSQFNPLWNQGIAWLAYPTLIYANFLALQQTELRRFFAYSGISHAGFLLIPLVANAMTPLLFYLSIYAIATLGAFAIIASLNSTQEGPSLKDLQGLFYRSPLLATVLILSLLTLAGIPPTAGFFAKFFIFKAAIQAGYYALVTIGLLTTILSAFYYLRIITLLFTKEEAIPLPLSPAATSVALTASFAMIWLAIVPSTLLNALP